VWADNMPMVDGTGTWFATNSKVVEQNANRSVGLTSNTLPQNVQAGAELLQKDENAKLLVRYWLGNDKNNAIVQEMEFSESYKEDSFGKNVQKIIGNPLAYKGEDINNASPQDMQIETIVIPSSGSPMTYARHLYRTGKQKYVSFLPKNIKILAAEGSGALGRWDGILEADDIKYKDSEGNIVTQDLGYGFIGSEYHFSSSVPNETDKILIDITGEIFNRKEVISGYTVSIDGREKIYESGEAIPLEVGVNKLTVNCKAAVGKDSTYTIDVTRRSPSKQKFQKVHPYL
jgi:hypothetical protein